LSDGWLLLTIGAGLFGWTIFLDVKYKLDKRLAAWWVAQARRRGRATGLFAFGLSAAAMVGYVLLLVPGALLTAELGHLAWAICFVLPQTLAYMPFMVATIPSHTGYYAWRHDLAAAGATARQQRQITWWAGPPSLIGMIAMISAAMALVLG